jgi:hypothetical protein
VTLGETMAALAVKQQELAAVESEVSALEEQFAAANAKRQQLSEVPPPVPCHPCGLCDHSCCLTSHMTVCEERMEGCV